MSGIPEHIRGTARRIVDAFSLNTTQAFQRHPLAAMIEDALLAEREEATKRERERCARVAEAERDASKHSLIIPAVADVIAASIRTPLRTASSQEGDKGGEGWVRRWR